MTPRKNAWVPDGACGWLTFSPKAAPPKSGNVVANDIAVADAVDSATYRDSDLRIFRMARVKLTEQSPDAPTMIRALHQAHPTWTRAQIGEELGLADWYISLVLESSCKRHKRHD